MANSRSYKIVNRDDISNKRRLDENKTCFLDRVAAKKRK